jgi:hypothetical protein
MYLIPLASLRGADVEFVTQELPWAIVDKPYSPPPLEARTSGACTSGGIGYAVVSGVLPPGLELSRLGYFSGVPLRTGSFEIVIRVTTGCSWTTKHFLLISTGAPVLSANPLKLEFRSSLAQKQSPPEQVVHISSTWPKLAYAVASSADWVGSTPDRGFTPRAGSALSDDALHVRVDPSHLKPGQYQATLAISAWQAMEAFQVTVELIVTE